MTPLFFSTNTLGHFPIHFPAFRYNLFVFEKKTKRIFASIGGKPPNFWALSKLGAFFNSISYSKDLKMNEFEDYLIH
jgi:hypothetical protein